MKRLRSVETLGSTSAINSDKTGTLTLNQMTAVQMAVVGRRYAISGEGYSTIGQITHVAGQPDVPLDQLLLPMALCADAEVKDGKLVGDPTEGALVVLAAKGGVDPTLTREQYPRVATLPFDAAYKLMATFHRMTDDAGKDVIRAYVKGAPDQLLARADGRPRAGRRRGPGRRRSATTTWPRTSGSARRACASWRPARRTSTRRRSTRTPTCCRSSTASTLLALVGIVDPPRPEARDAIAKAHEAGIQVRMITGDHAVTAEAIASQLGHQGPGDHRRRVRRDGRRRGRRARSTTSASSPASRRSTRSTSSTSSRRKGHIVAMTGDGVNDAPALKKADIGVAMGITGTEVSKEAAVMILTDDNFATIVKAVELGRALYDNLMRYIRFQMAVPVRVHRDVPRREHLQHPRRASRSCRSRRCGSTSPSTSSWRSGSATASRARA